MLDRRSVQDDGSTVFRRAECSEVGSLIPRSQLAGSLPGVVRPGVRLGINAGLAP